MYRGGHFQLHTLYLEDFHDLEGIITDQAHLRLLGIHQTSHIKTPWAKVKGLYHSSPRRYASPMILVLDDWFSASRWMTMFPAFSDPEVQEYHKIATSPRGLNKFYEEGYALCFCLLGVSEKNGNLLGDMMKAMAQIHSSSYPKWYLYSTLKIIVHDTSIHVSIILVCLLDIYHSRIEAMAVFLFCSICTTVPLRVGFGFLLS